MEHPTTTTTDLAAMLLLAIGCRPVHVDGPSFLFPPPSAATVSGPSIGRKRRRRRARGRALKRKIA